MWTGSPLCARVLRTLLNSAVDLYLYPHLPDEATEAGGGGRWPGHGRWPPARQ